MLKMKTLTGLTLVLSDVTIAFALTVLLIAWAPSFAALGTLGFLLLFVLLAAFVALVTVVSLSFAKPNAAAKRVIAARDLAIHLREKALNEHTIVSIAHPDGRIAAVNGNFVETLGYEPDDIIGAPSEVIFWSKDDGNVDEVRDVVNTGRIWKGTERLRTKDDRCLTVETTVLPRFDDTGKFENSISIRTDVSRAKAQGVTEGRNAIIEALPDEVYIYDAKTFRLSYANGNARHRLRRNLEELPQLSLIDVFSDDEKRRFKRHVAPILSGECQRAHLEIDHATGPFEVLTHLDRAPDGTASLVSVVRDVSERKKAEQIRLSSVATVSHELRTPLTSIKGALRLLESGVAGDLGGDAARMVTVARRNSDRLLSIVNDILALEKLASGQIDMARKPIDLRALLTEAVEANAAFAADCGVRFRIDHGDGPASVTGDPDRLMQVMSNLMSNAAKFSPEGSEVTLGIEDRNELWRVYVTDTGPGIPEAARKTLFDNFTQVEGTADQRHEGTGLGLAICREILSLHRGQIAFDTSVGEGSTFYFELAKRDESVAADQDEGLEQAGAVNVA
jgi:two-component system sensor histidine kinase VicK